MINGLREDVGAVVEDEANGPDPGEEARIYRQMDPSDYDPIQPTVDIVCIPTYFYLFPYIHTYMALSSPLSFLSFLPYSTSRSMYYYIAFSLDLLSYILLT